MFKQKKPSMLGEWVFSGKTHCDTTCAVLNATKETGVWENLQDINQHVMLQLVNYWRGGNTASPPAADQANFSPDNPHEKAGPLLSVEDLQDGEVEIMKTRQSKIQEVRMATYF